MKININVRKKCPEEKCECWNNGCMIEWPDAMCTRSIVQENTSIQDFYRPNKDNKEEK
jgi:hypothetical protein